MISIDVKKELFVIWDNYAKNDRRVIDKKGSYFEDIDKSRLFAIEEIKKIIHQFSNGSFNIYEFKTNLDSYNKKHNYWGFTAAKGQMFFNLLTKASENDISLFSDLIKKVIKEPRNLEEAIEKITLLFNYVKSKQTKITDKRKGPNPKSAAYFLSYFWQIHNYEKWPVMYSSIIISLTELGLWQDCETAQENYKSFFSLNNSIKEILSTHTGNKVNNWEIEHALWNFSGTQSINSKQPKKKEKNKTTIIEEVKVANASFDLNDYIVPKVSNILTLGSTTEKSGASKGSDFEKKVSEVFELLDFDVQLLGQGSGREPDAIIKFREEHVAFIVDAKAYSGGYSLGTDDRAIKEYINHYCPKLRQDGFTKIGFIIVSNSFKSELNELINTITWTTDIKRFYLLTTEALLYLLAYKTKERLSLTQIIEILITLNPLITKETIIEQFEDY